jgi:hypothetical protein
MTTPQFIDDIQAVCSRCRIYVMKHASFSRHVVQRTTLEPLQCVCVCVCVRRHGAGSESGWKENLLTVDGQESAANGQRPRLLARARMRHYWIKCFCILDNKCRSNLAVSPHWTLTCQFAPSDFVSGYYPAKMGGLYSKSHRRPNCWRRNLSARVIANRMPS